VTPRIQVVNNQGDFLYNAAENATDIALQVSTISREEIDLWDKQKIVDSIILEAQASPQLAREIADEVEKALVASGQTRVTTSLIRELVDLQLMERGLSHMLEKHTNLGLPMYDVENIITEANKENSNTTHNPESINLTIAETVLKQYALERIFTEDIARAHYEGAIHLHDLGFCVRPYCGGHSLEYVKKYGLRLPNITSTSKPARHPDVLIGHMVKMASTLQSYYAGAIGWEAVNVFFAPFLVDLPYQRIKAPARRARGGAGR
jgi:anaerobic ribonucleoside-triphosphate reductase